MQLRGNSCKWPSRFDVGVERAKQVAWAVTGSDWQRYPGLPLLQWCANCHARCALYRYVGVHDQGSSPACPWLLHRLSAMTLHGMWVLALALLCSFGVKPCPKPNEAVRGLPHGASCSRATPPAGKQRRTSIYISTNETPILANRSA